MRIFLQVCYDGTDFFGWQKQKGRRTVAGVLEECIEGVLGAQVTLKGAARTDRGVHAMAQTAHFDIAAAHIPASSLAAALNRALPPDIRAVESREVEGDFHARLRAKGKTYLYKLYISKIQHPLYLRTHYIVAPPFDMEKARECLELLTGTHDFTSFCYVDRHAVLDSKVRTISAANITREGDEVLLEITGNGFLHNMVRIMAGTIVKITKNRKCRPADIQDILQARDRQRAASTAPACGLYLKEVLY